MSREDPHEHLSRISTLWTLVRKAHGGESRAVSAAQEILIERYSGAVRRYLCAALRDAEAADELFQEFCLRLLRGDFKRADPQRGRFRDFLKTAVFHLIVDYHKQKRRKPQALAAEAEAAQSPDEATCAREFLESWRDELLSRTWAALAEHEKASGQPHHSVLSFRTAHPLLSSEQLAQELGARLGKSYSVHAIRQALHRARERFAELLLDEVARTLQRPIRENVEAELLEVGLLPYCRSAFHERYGK